MGGRMTRFPGPRKAVTVAKKTSVKSAIDVEQIKATVANFETVANFLRNLADQAAADPNTHSEIVKSATLIRLFLENQVNGIKQQSPGVFDAKSEGTENKSN